MIRYVCLYKKTHIIDSPRIHPFPNKRNKEIVVWSNILRQVRTQKRNSISKRKIHSIQYITRVLSPLGIEQDGLYGTRGVERDGSACPCEMERKKIE